MIKRYNNFVEFAAEMGPEFMALPNERLKHFCNLSNTLNQGCGCTRGQRAEAALKEYFSIGEFLDEPSLALIRAKYPSHSVEFAQDGGVFFVIEPI